jgi:hypothetical protein
VTIGWNTRLPLPLTLGLIAIGFMLVIVVSAATVDLIKRLVKLLKGGR